VGVVSLTLVVASALHAQAPAPTSQPRPARRPFAALSASANEMRDSLVSLARAQLGTKYVFGGTSPRTGFDCSGLIKYLAQALDLSVPRTSAQQARVGTEVAKDPKRLRPGDLLTVGTGKRVSHIGIYIGDGKYIHASTGSGKVIESRLDRAQSRGVKPWLGVRRLLSDADSGDASEDGKSGG
jgi:cell wall-associated NlpC family hydrolase